MSTNWHNPRQDALKAEDERRAKMQSTLQSLGQMGDAELVAFARGLHTPDREEWMDQTLVHHAVDREIRMRTLLKMPPLQ